MVAVVAATKGQTMKKNDKMSISGALAAATCTLLGTAAVEPVEAQEEPG